MKITITISLYSVRKNFMVGQRYKSDVRAALAARWPDAEIGVWLKKSKREICVVHPANNDVRREVEQIAKDVWLQANYHYREIQE